MHRNDLKRIPRGVVLQNGVYKQIGNYTHEAKQFLRDERLETAELLVEKARKNEFEDNMSAFRAVETLQRLEVAIQNDLDFI